jgi:predicted MFS family arabinose efflux permease
LSAAWFASFALMQIPVGMALDRFGPRRTVASLMTLAVIGAVVFANADAMPLAIAGQALIGAGCAPVYMGTLVAVSRWFPADRFALLSSVVLACATAGILLSSRPFAMLAEALGWRGAMLVVGAVAALAQLLVAALARGPQQVEAAPSATEGLAELARGVATILRIRALWPLLPICFAGYASLIAVRGLWAGPYLDAVFGLSPVARGDVLLLMSVAMLLGTLAYAGLERLWHSRRRPVIVGSLMLIAGLAILAVVPDHSIAATAMLLALVGASASTYVLIMAQGRLFIPQRLIGRGMTFLNCVSFAGVAAMQQVSGVVLQTAERAGTAAAPAYGWLFGFLAAVLCVATAAYLLSRDAPLTPGVLR